MTSPVVRAGAVAAIGSLGLLAPLLGWGTALLFGGVAILAVALPRESALFGLLAGPGDLEAGRLERLAGFAMTATALALLATVDAFGLSIPIFAMTLLLLGGGNLTETIYRGQRGGELGALVAFGTGGALAGFGGYVIVEGLLSGGPSLALATVTFLVTTGALLGALCRTDLYRRDDPVVLLTVGLILWLFGALAIDPTWTTLALGLIVTAALGVLAYVTKTASIAGMLSGVLLGFVTIVLGGFHWFAVLFAFFALGGMATKYRYHEKAERGVAEADRGARGTGNVLGNALVALAAVVGYAAAPDVAALGGTTFAIAFVAAVGTALADTLSSEIGSLYDTPKLITSFEEVEPGTNGGVTLEGEIAGFLGAGGVAALGIGLFPEIDPTAGVLVLLGGIAGMTADSVLGATLEGSVMGNGGVNLLATLIGAVVAVGGAIWLGIVPG